MGVPYVEQNQLSAIENNLKLAVDAHLSKDIAPFPRWSNWAGDIGFDCDTYHALCRLKPELRPLVSLQLKKVFRVGSTWETPNLQLLQNAGVKVVEQGRPYQWREKKISGKIDAKIATEIDGQRFVVPFEHKTCAPSIFHAIGSAKASGTPLQKAKQSWVRKYPAQLQIYDLMEGVPFGVWMFFNKVNGDYFFWAQAWDPEYCEELVQRAERANENVDNEFIPPAVRKEACSDCDFANTACFVGKDFGPGYDIVVDDEIKANVRRALELEPSADEYLEIMDGLKELFKGKSAMTDEFLIESKPYETTIYAVPLEIRKEHAKKITAYRFSIKPLK